MMKRSGGFRPVSRIALSSLLAFCLGFGVMGCASTQGAAAASSESSDSAGSSDAQQSVPVLDESAYDFSCTERDFDASYDESEATRISWVAGAVSVEGQGVSASDVGVTIDQEGVYVLSGTASGAQILVEAADDAKVQLVLDGLDIESADGPAIYVKQAKKCFITLPTGSKNSVADASTYTLAEGEDEPDAAIFSKCNLTIQGEGLLSVAGNYSCGVKSKDDLVVTGGNVEVSSVGKGIVGRDRLTVAGGSVSVASQGDALKSTNEDAGKGFVSIEGGAVSVVSGDAGIKAENLVRVTGGQVAIESADDALHSNGDVHVVGGAITASAGDDGTHADKALQVDGGTIDITKSYEGLEGNVIYLNDGDISVVSSDDGLNAASKKSSEATAAAEGASTEAPDSGQSSKEAEEPEAPSVEGADRLQSAKKSEADSGDSPQNLGEQEPLQAADTDSSAEAPDRPQNADGGAQQGRGKQNGGARGGMETADESCLIVINGGTLSVDAQGDGIDSNGDLVINGGTVFVSGPAGQGDGALDYDGTATVNGGTVIAAGARGMAASFTQGGQAFALINAAGDAGDSIDVVDSSGNVEATFAPAKSFECVVVSSPVFSDNDSCRIVVNGTTYSADSGQSSAVARNDSAVKDAPSAKPTE